MKLSSMLNRTTGITLALALSGCGQQTDNNEPREILTKTTAYSLFKMNLKEIEDCLRHSRAFYLDFQLYNGARDYPVFDTFTANIYQKVEAPVDYDAGIYTSLDPLKPWQSGDMHSPLYLVSAKGNIISTKVGERLSKIAPKRNTCVGRVFKDTLQGYKMNSGAELKLRFIVENGLTYIKPRR